MSKYIYLACNPEALIASMLPPDKFGMYLSSGTKKRNRGQAIFFEIDPDKTGTLIDSEMINKRCVVKENGSPKSSVYLSIYRVLEMIPVSALKNLYLTTESGVVLELQKSEYDFQGERSDALHLYQELCPVSPLVATDFSPSVFIKKITDRSSNIFLPGVFFVELKLGELAEDPFSGSAENLPYSNIGHLRDCLEILKGETDKHMKIVQRYFYGRLLYRTIKTGFFIGSGDEFNYYSYPSMSALENTNYEFFRAI